MGINDAGWVVGAQGQSGFVYKNQQLIPFQLGLDTSITGINGQGTVVIDSSTDGSTGFVYLGDASGSGSIVVGDPLTCKGSSYLGSSGINNNGQVVGGSGDPIIGGGLWWNGGVCAVLSGGGFAGVDGSTYNLNDLAQITGETFLSSTPQSYGFVLVPNVPGP